MAPACAVVLGGCGATVAWRFGLFNSDGRFEDVDACELMPDTAILAPLVSNGSREPGDSKPDGLFGWGGDARSECKWSSTPRRVDQPFRTVRVFAKTTHATTDQSGPERAIEDLENWYSNRMGRGQEVTPADVGERGYRTIDKTSIVIVMARIDVFDIHAKFRISNVVVDVSARTHDQPGNKEKAQVTALAGAVANRLKSHD